MSVYAYRLFTVQTFKGRKVAVYLYVGNYPDPEIISDATDIIKGIRSRSEVVNGGFGKYDVKENPTSAKLNRKNLTFWVRALMRSQKFIDSTTNVEYAIFVNETAIPTWRGENQLYKLKVFDILKSDTPEYSGTEKLDEILTI